MIRLLYGTTNQGKLAYMRNLLSDMPLELLSLTDMHARPCAVPETGSSPLDNAVQKAKAYYAQYQFPVFSLDCGLFLYGIPDNEQPGVHVRRVAGRELNDAEMLHYYKNIATQHGGRIKARYSNALCAVWGFEQAHCFASMEDALSSAPFYLVDKPKGKPESGLPLDCISVKMQTGRYFSDNDYGEEGEYENGFRAFFATLLERIETEYARSSTAG